MEVKKKNIPKRPGEADKSLADIKKIKQHLNWKPEISIKDGVKMLIESRDKIYYEKNYINRKC